MGTKQIIPGITAAILGAVWLVMTLQHQTPPAILVQGIVAAVGSLAAGSAVGQAKKEESK
jgi:hypothetical protein